MIIQTSLEFGDFVYLKTDPQQERKMVIGISIYPPTTVKYILVSGQFESAHYDFEISTEKDLNLINE